MELKQRVLFGEGFVDLPTKRKRGQRDEPDAEEDIKYEEETEPLEESDEEEGEEE